MSGPDFIEIGTDDEDATRAFFENVMGWSWEMLGEGPAGFFTDGKRQVGMHVEETMCMVPYLNVADIAATVARVTAARGTVMGEIAEAPGLGRFATCTDPRGVRFGLHQA